MPASAAIPLACIAPGNVFNIGTGFLARHKGVIALVTAAHIPTGSIPTAEWAKWPLQIQLFLNKESYVTAQLFENSGGARAPKFRFLAASPPRIADIMVLTGLMHQDVLNCLEIQYPVLDFGEANLAPAPGNTLTCYGFPERHPPQWPYTPPFSSTGSFIRRDGPMFEAEMTTQTGQSGGPVFDASDRFVGMQIGSNEGVTQIVPADALAHFWP